MVSREKIVQADSNETLVSETSAVLISEWVDRVGVERAVEQLLEVYRLECLDPDVADFSKIELIETVVDKLYAGEMDTADELWQMPVAELVGEMEHRALTDEPEPNQPQFSA